ncbi:MAG: winged helix-turn-helix transcriptional regulator [Pararhodobacter sp.]|nr:winged helix-turn-helix transcriptional regulator [Pararhodobacter sp.]
MLAQAEQTSDYLKALSHPTRLVILCRLAEGTANVGELEALLELPQAAVSKQLARLRAEGLVVCRRDGRNVFYSLGDARTERIIGALYTEFCAPGAAAPAGAAGVAPAPRP